MGLSDWLFDLLARWVFVFRHVAPKTKPSGGGR